MSSTPAVLGSPTPTDSLYLEQSSVIPNVVITGTLSPAKITGKSSCHPGDDQKHPNTLDSYQKQPNGFYRTTLIVPLSVQTMDMHSRVDNSIKPQNGDGNANENTNIVGLGVRTFGTSVNNTSNPPTSYNLHSMTQRRIASKIPVLQSDLQLSAPPPSWSNHAMLNRTSPNNDPTISKSHTIPVTPVEQLLHTPFQPPEIQRRTKTGSRSDDYGEGWLWPASDSYLGAMQSPIGPSSSFLPQTPTNDSHFLHNVSAVQPLFILNNPSATHPVSSRLPRRLSYSKPYAASSSPLVLYGISSALARPSGNTIIDPYNNENLASPLHIKSVPSTYFDDTFSSTGSPSSFEALR